MSERAGGERVARASATVFSPTLVLALLFPLTGLLALRTWEGAAWGVLAAAFAAGFPAGIVHHGVLAGLWTDHHVSRREQRGGPLAASIGSVALGLVVLRALDAPRTVVSLLVVVLVTLVAATLTTLVWKISFHAAVIAVTAATLTVVGGGAWAVAWLAVPVVGWARVRLGAHTVAQVVAGALLGGAVAVAVML